MGEGEHGSMVYGNYSANVSKYSCSKKTMTSTKLNNSRIFFNFFILLLTTALLLISNEKISCFAFQMLSDLCVFYLCAWKCLICCVPACLCEWSSY